MAAPRHNSCKHGSALSLHIYSLQYNFLVMRTSVNISFFVSAEPAASTASKKDYRSTAYNNYCIKSAAPRHCLSELNDAQVLHDFSADLVDLDTRFTLSRLRHAPRARRASKPSA